MKGFDEAKWLPCQKYREGGGGESTFHIIITFSYFINQENLIIHVQCDTLFQCITNIYNQ